MSQYCGRSEFVVKNKIGKKVMRSVAAAAAVCACVSMFAACTDGRNSGGNGTDSADMRGGAVNGTDRADGMIGDDVSRADQGGGLIGGAAPGMGNEPSR